MPMACATASNASSTKSSITAGSQRATKRRHAIFSRWSCSPPLWSGCETWSKCQQDLVGVDVRDRKLAQVVVIACRAPPAVGAADRELRCAGTAVERAGAVEVAGHHSLWAGSAIVVRIRHRAFLSDFERALRVWANAGSNSQP